MSFYYVKAGGGAVGDAGRADIARTGSFASMGAANYYDSVYDVFAGGVPTTDPDGDFIIASDIHVESGNQTIGVRNATANGLNSIHLRSVDDTDVSVYKKGASITYNSGNLYFAAYVASVTSFYCEGFEFTASGTVDLRIQNNTVGHIFKDCDFTCTYINAALSKAIFYDCNGTFSTGNSVYCVSAKWYGGTITSTYASWVLTRGQYFDCDLSGSTSSNIVRWPGIKIKLERCKVKGLGLLSASSIAYNDVTEILQTDTADGYYNETYYSYFYEITTSLTVYLDYTYDDSIGASILIESTNASTDKDHPIRHKLVEIPAQDLTAATTYRINFVTDSNDGGYVALTDTNLWIEGEYSDATDLALGIIQTTRNDDTLGAGDAVSTDTTNNTSWTVAGLTTPVYRYIEFTTPASGMDDVDNTNVTIYVNFAVPNMSIFADPLPVITT